MSTNAKPGNMGPKDPKAEQPEENVAQTAFDPSFNGLDFDRDHGAEVEAARRELAQWDLIVRAA